MVQAVQLYHMLEVGSRGFQEVRFSPGPCTDQGLELDSPPYLHRLPRATPDSYQTCKSMTLSDLLEDVFGALPEDRRKMVQALVDEYGAGENLRLLLALVASADRRERRLARLLINDIDRQELARENR